VGHGNMDWLNQHSSELISFFAGLLSGSVLTMTYSSYKSKRTTTTVVDQSYARAGGDITGGNKSTNESGKK
jgi:uncharacterized membrane protein